MSETKHTPGPWILVGNAIVPASDPETEFPIAEIYGKANSAANARLIAAAPDMGAFLLRLRDNDVPAQEELNSLLEKAGLL